MTHPAAQGGRAWVAFGAGLMLGSVILFRLPTASLDWQPGLAERQPWRAWTAVFVHWSTLHLFANLGAAAVVVAFGATARVSGSMCCAWIMAWPLTQWGLATQPALTHYGGLSGVLHAGVAIVVLWLLNTERGSRRAIGAAVLAGLVIKIATEEPFGPPLRIGDGWDIAVAPVAHFTGALAGTICAAPLLAIRRFAAVPWRPRRR